MNRWILDIDPLGKLLAVRLQSFFDFFPQPLLECTVRPGSPMPKIDVDRGQVPTRLRGVLFGEMAQQDGFAEVRRTHNRYVIRRGFLRVALDAPEEGLSSQKGRWKSQNR